MLADAIRTDRARLRPLERGSDLAEEIRLRDRARTRKVEHRNRLSNQLRQALARYYPALLELRREMHDPFLLALLRAYPEPGIARAGRTPRLARLLAEHRVRALSADDLARQLRAPALSPPAHVTTACRDEALDLAAQIVLLNQQVAAAEARLDELLEAHPDREALFEACQGWGVASRSGWWPTLGDSRDRWADRSSLQAFAGTAPVTRRSGKRGVMSITMRKGCNRTFQAALFTMARCSRARSGWARAYYDHARKHGMRHATAVRALSNKWAKILAAVLRTGEPYDEARHVARLRERGVAWAKDLPAKAAA